MTSVTVRDDNLCVRLSLFEALFAFKRGFEIPLAHVRGATTETPRLSKVFRGIRIPGTHIPGLIVAGNFRQGETLTFWSVRRGQQIVAIELQDETFDRLALGVRDAAATVADINRALEGGPV